MNNRRLARVSIIVALGFGLLFLIGILWSFYLLPDCDNAFDRASCLDTGQEIGGWIQAYFVGFFASIVGGGVGYFFFMWRVGKVESSEPKANLVSQKSDPVSVVNADIETELRNAKQMLDQGLIDDEEYKSLKQKIIERS